MSDLTTPLKASDDEIKEFRSQKTLTEVIYLCQALGFIFGGIPFILAVIINYIKRDQVKGTWLESHFDWQIKTFWVALALTVVGFATMGLGGLGMIILAAATFWTIYRIAFGWFAANANERVVEKGIYF
jgi:uncharacterized membrane protein